jgi:addiction module HigA family antidote
MSIMHNPLHPGEIVRDALFNETGIDSVGDAAQRLKVNRITLSRLLNGHSGISPEMAYRLSLLLNTSPEMWLNIQRDYDLWQIKKHFKQKHLKIDRLAA